MKKSLLLALLLFSIRTVFGAGGDADYEPSQEATHIPAMILVDDGEDVNATIAELEAEGVVILRHRQNILLSFIPIERVSTLKRARGVRKIDASNPRYNQPTLNQARLFYDANLINEGAAALAQPFTGKGVVVGVCDIGIDTRHPTFLDHGTGESRIRRVVHYEEQQGLRTVMSDPEEIYTWQTDDPDDYHGTHTTGIAAGAHLESGYYSLAYEADIVFTASQLSDVGLLAGVEDIIEYAKEVKKPAVINLSMGNNLGPHDGTSLFTRYLDLCADDAIICISAGNDGDSSYMCHSMTHDFTADKPELRVVTCDMGGTKVAGMAEVWSADDTPFRFAYYWRSQKTNSPAIDYDFIAFPEDGETQWRISADPDDPDYDETMAAFIDTGYISVTGGKSPLNGRFYAYMEVNFQTSHRMVDDKGDVKGWAEFWPSIRLEGLPGQHIDICTMGDFGLWREPGYAAPNNNLSISDLATGSRTVSVGMMCNTDVMADANPGSGFLKGEVCNYSSYGTLADGRKMPMTVAPGAYVISAVSNPFLEAHPDFLPYIDDTSDFNGNTVYWMGDLGTSMSCPFVASAIATWLQAYPALTSEEAISIIRRTNRTSGYPYPENPRHGQGWFDAMSGMGKVLELAALKVGTIDSPDTTIRFDGHNLLIGNPAGGEVALEIYTLSGLPAGRLTASGTMTTVSLSYLPKGAYIVRCGNIVLKFLKK